MTMAVVQLVCEVCGKTGQTRAKWVPRGQKLDVGEEYICYECLLKIHE